MMDRQPALRFILLICTLVVHPSGVESAFAETPDWLSIQDDLAREHSLEEHAIDAVRDRMAGWVDDGFGFVEVAWNTRISIRSTEQIEYSQSVARFFVSDSGATQAGTFEIGVTTSRSHLVIDRAYLLLPNGRRESVDPESIQINDPLEPNLFSDVQNVVLPLRGVVPGAIAFFEYRTIRNIDAQPMPWSSLFYGQSSVPILSQQIIVESEREKGWYEWASNDPLLECVPGPKDRLVCQRGESPALRMDGVVRSYFDLIPHFIVAERATWHEISAGIADLVNRKSKVSDAMREEVERIRRDFQGRESQTAELYRVVSNQVRYLGFEHGDSAVIPHAASETWDKRFGDCKDKVTLFVAMARELGIEAHAVLTSTTNFDAAGALIPASSYFDHMIVCQDGISVDDGCVDVTLTGSPAELPYVLQGGLALHASGTGAGRIQSLPRREILWQVSVEREVELLCDGSMRERVVRSQGGSWGNALRSGLAQISPSERSQYLLSEFSQATALVEERPEMKVSGLAKINEPWSVTYSATPSRRVPMDGVQHFHEWNPWLSFSVASLLGENREHDFHFAGIDMATTSIYRVCDEARLGYLGGGLGLDSPWGQLSREYRRLEKNVVRVESRFKMKGGSVSPAQLDDIRLFIGRTLAQSAIQFEYRFED